MLKFHKIVYKNIGPFSNQTKVVKFEKGKFLIKSPIGSGKSFLYFDGPTYALYKWSSRKILNTKCQTGKIEFEFEVDGIQYKIERNLKKGKTKDSCKSKFRVQGEEVVFKNETDLQGNIEQILPPRKVFLATFLLMQDSPNIFELQPQERLEIFKHIFDLLSIDEGKEILSEKKRNLQAKIKVLENTEKYDEKLNNFLQSLKIITENIEDKNVQIRTFLNEISVFIGKINCKDFHFELKGNEFEKIKTGLEEKKQNYTILQTNFENIKNNFNQKIIEKTNKEKNIENIKIEIKSLETKSSEFDLEKLNDKKEQKKVLSKNQIEIDNTAKDESEKFFGKEENIQNISQLWEKISDLIQNGKILREKKNSIESEIKLAKQKEIEKKNETKRQKEKFEESKSLQKEKIENTTKLIQEKEKELTEFESIIEGQSQFKCEKIDGQCPFIKVINKKTFDNLEQQKQSIVKKIENLKQEKKDLEIEFEKKFKSDVFSEKVIENREIFDISRLEKNDKKIEKEIEEVKKVLEKINWKVRKEKFENYKEISENIKKFDTEIWKYEELEKQIGKYKEKIFELKGQIEQEKKSILDLTKDLKILEKEKTGLEKNLEEQKHILTEVSEKEKNIKNYENIVEKIKTLLSDFKSTQIETKKNKEEFKILSDLYNLFSKELLLLVLQESIPILNEIVNSYLAMVVEYQIKMGIVKDGDKVLLEIIVLDKLGEREVNALSGGQKVVLKIARMLAIASYMKTSMLFLDETINNLDLDSIGGVAEILESFVKQKQIDLYVVTHSAHIQQMDIWDGILEIH